MHIHQHEARRVLRQDVDAMQLAEREAQRRTVLGRGQRRRGGRHERVVRLRRLRERERRLDAGALRDGGIGDRRVCRARRQRALQCVPHELVHHARIAKAHLDLRRMDVHIHRPWIERQKQEISGLPLPMQQLGIGLPHGVRNHPVAHIAAVDEEILAICARLRCLWRAGKSGERHAAGGSLHHHARFGELAAEQRRGALRDRLVTQMASGAAVVA